MSKNRSKLENIFDELEKKRRPKYTGASSGIALLKELYADDIETLIPKGVEIFKKPVNKR
jgi:hypothetical protein